MFIYKVWWTAFLCIYTPQPFYCCFPSQLIKHCCSLTSTFGASILFCFLFALLSGRGCFGSGAILSSKCWPMEGGVWVGDLVYMCVCTQLCYSASVLRSNANKSNSWNLKWQNFSPFHSPMFVLGYSAAFHSCEVNRFSLSAKSVAAGNLRAGQLDMILYKNSCTFMVQRCYAVFLCF